MSVSSLQNKTFSNIRYQRKYLITAKINEQIFNWEYGHIARVNILYYLRLRRDGETADKRSRTMYFIVLRGIKRSNKKYRGFNILTTVKL